MRTFTVRISHQSRVITRKGMSEPYNKLERDSKRIVSFGHLEVNWRIILRQILKSTVSSYGLHSYGLKGNPSGVFILTL